MDKCEKCATLTAERVAETERASRWILLAEEQEARAEKAEAERAAMQIAWEALQVGAAESERDAARYRRLRNRGKDMAVHVAVLTHNGGYCPTGDECDAAIDATIERGAT